MQRNGFQQEKHRAEKCDLRGVRMPAHAGAVSRLKEPDCGETNDHGRHQELRRRSIRIEVAHRGDGPVMKTVPPTQREFRREAGIDDREERPRPAARDEARSEERRVGKEGVSTCRSRWSPDHSKKKTKTKSEHEKSKK